MLLASRTHVVFLALIAAAAAQHTWIVGNFAQRGAVYNSTGWHEPLAVSDYDGEIITAAVSGNDCKLYLGGAFTGGVKSFDGAVSEDLSTAGGIGGTVNALEYSGASLYVGGLFDTAGSLDVADLNLVSYSGSSFLQVGGGGVDAAVNGLAAAGSSLYIGGAFTTLGASYTARAGVYSFIDEAIASLGTGSTANAYPIQSGAVNSVGVFGGAEYFGCSNCVLEDEGLNTNGLAIYTGGSSWLGTTTWTAATVFRNGLAAGDDVMLAIGNGGNCGVMAIVDPMRQEDMPTEDGCNVITGTPVAVTWSTGNTFRIVDNAGALFDVEYDDGVWTTTLVDGTGSYSNVNAIVMTSESVGQSSLCTPAPVAGSAMTPSLLLVSVLAAALAVLF